MNKTAEANAEAASGKKARAAIIILCIAVVSAAVIASLYIQGIIFSRPAPIIRITIANKTGVQRYAAFHATTQSQMVEGLMNYTFGSCTADETNSTCANEPVGELFSFGYTANQCFWMKNTPEELIQAWLSENGTVTYVYDGIPYSTNVVCSNGSAVLELGKTLGIPLKVGDVVKVA
jgi:uncharacterized membrane protein (UPF0127 family)